MSSFQVFFQPLGEYGTNAYLVVHGNSALAIDAPPGALKFFSNVVKQRGLKWNYLLLTHSHFDHIADASKIQEIGIKVGVHPLDRANCVNPGCDGLPLMMSTGPFNPDFFLDKDLITLDEFKISIIHTPGHTPGGCCFTIDKLMFSGDTLFKSSIGNLSFKTCNSRDMSRSLKKLLEISENYTVYPGHGMKTDLDMERENIKHFIKNIG